MQKDLLWSKAGNVNELKFGRQTFFGLRTLWSIKHGYLEDHYTAQFSWQTDPTPSSNLSQIHGTLLHHISFTYTIIHRYLDRLMGCNGVAGMYGWLAGGRCNGVAWTYDWLTPSHEQRCIEYHYTKLGRSAGWTTPPIYQRSMADHYTESVSWQTDPTPTPINHRCMVDHYTT